MICCVCEWETHKQVTWHYENIEIILSCYFAPSLSCSRCSNPFCYLRSSRNSYICVEVWYSMHLMKNSRWNGNFLTVFFSLSLLFACFHLWFLSSALSFVWLFLFRSCSSTRFSSLFHSMLFTFFPLSIFCAILPVHLKGSSYILYAENQKRRENSVPIFSYAPYT